MPTRALLLCDDEKAQAAVAQILVELKVAFEHFHEPTPVLSKLTTQRFDAILVDCANEEDATLVFQSAHTSIINQAAMTIAIVEGKAGVPSGFRLGARMVMTKPVSLEQARSVLRAAFAMQRKIAQEGATAPAPKPSTEVVSKTAKGMAASANPVTSEPAEPTPKYSLSFKPQPLPDVTDVSPDDPATSDSKTILAPVAAKTSSASVSESLPVTAPRPKEPAMKSATSKAEPASEMFLEDDPFSPGELEGRVITGRMPAASSVPPEKPRRRVSSALVALIIVFLAVDGFYAMWTLKPEFQDVVLEQYGRLHERLTGTPPKPLAAATAPQSAPAPVQPRASKKPGTAPAPAAPAATPDANVPATAPSTDTPVADGFSSSQGSASEGFKSDSTLNKSTAATALRDTSASVPKTNDDDEPVVVPEKLADAHVVHRVRPAYPTWVRNKGVQGDVVLQASVHPDGTVASIQVVSGKPQLTPSAVAAVKRWRYEPYFRNGQAVEFQTRVTVQFRLSQPASR